MMSDGVAPFVSSSPPPFDEENFRFEEDDYDLYKGNNTSEHLSFEDITDEFHGDVLEMERSKVNNFPQKFVYTTAVEDGAGEEFDDFIDYQTTLSDDYVYSTESINDSFKSRNNVHDRNDTDSNKSNYENLNEKINKVVTDEFEVKDTFRHIEPVTKVTDESGSTRQINGTEGRDPSKKLETECNEEEDFAETRFSSVNVVSREVEDDLSSYVSSQEVENDSILLHDDINLCTLPQPRIESAYVNEEFDHQESQDGFGSTECWAQFEEFVAVPPTDEKDDVNDDNHGANDDDDDFGGFEGVIEQPTRANLDDFKDALVEAFHLTTNTDERRLKSLERIINSDAEFENDKVWKKIRSIEMTPALSMQWKTSFLLRSFLKSINITQQSRDSNVPVFAVNLRLLEPRKLHGGGSSDGKEDVNPADVPSVEFDWANSVLMDPLDACKREKELLESLEPSHSDPHKSLSLHNFLATIAPNNTTLIRSPCDLSVPPQLQAILGRMPDLSFMQAKVLMFPLREEYVEN